MIRVKNSLKQGDALSPLLFNFVLNYAIMRVQIIQEGLKLNGTYQLLVYAYEVNKLGWSVLIRKENAEALVAARKDNGIKVSAKQSKYMVVSCNDIALRSHNTRNDNSSFDKLEQFIHLDTTLTDQNSIQEKLRPDWSQGLFVIIRCRIFCLPVCYLKI